jgi:hypothetical protein
MKRLGERRSKWQFSLGAMFGLLTLAGVGIWLLHGNLWTLIVTLSLAPLLVMAIVLEFAGYSEFAMLVGACTGVLWLILVVW